jgi:acetolactate synthase small subunit
MGRADTEVGTRSMSATRAWWMQLTDEPDALMRVLTLLRQRQCRLLSVHYDASDRHRPTTRLRVRVRPCRGRPDAVEAWLQGLVDVINVEPDA